MYDGILTGYETNNFSSAVGSDTGAPAPQLHYN
jgi:hypothetical protein